MVITQLAAGPVAVNGSSSAQYTLIGLDSYTAAFLIRLLFPWPHSPPSSISTPPSSLSFPLPILSKQVRLLTLNCLMRNKRVCYCHCCYYCCYYDDAAMVRYTSEKGLGRKEGSNTRRNVMLQYMSHVQCQCIKPYSNNYLKYKTKKRTTIL